MPDDYEIDLEGGFSGGVESTVKKESDQSTSNSNHNSNFNSYKPNDRRSPLPPQYNNNSSIYRTYSPSEPTLAVIIYNLDWWTNEEDIRGWAVDAGEEKSIKTVIFDEHKVNSKSKGTAYMEFDDVNATKRVYDHFQAKQKESRLTLQEQPSTESPELSSFLKLSITYTIPTPIPFKITHNKNQQARTGQGSNLGGGGGGGGQNRSGGINNMNRNGASNRNQHSNMQPFNYPVQGGGYNPMVQFPAGFPPAFGFPGSFYSQQPPPPQQQWQDSNNPHGSKRPRQ